MSELRSYDPPNKKQKIILIGGEKVGKTSILDRFFHNTFEYKVKTTIGCDFLSKNVQIGKTIIKQQVWDTAGSNRYKDISLSFYQDTDTFILVLDATKSIEEQKTTIEEYITNVKTQVNRNVPIYVAINKSDCKNYKLPDKNQIKQIFYENGIELQGDFIFFCSAKTGQNINELFEKIAYDSPQNLPDLTANSRISKIEKTINPSSKSPSAVALFFSGLWKKHKLWLAGNGVILAGAAVFFTLAAFAVGSFLTFGILPSAFIGAGIIVGGAFALWNIGYGIYTCYKDSRYQKVVPSEETSDDSIEKPLPTNPSVDKKTREKFKNDDIEPMFGNLPSGVNVEDASDSDNEDEKNKKFGM